MGTQMRLLAGAGWYGSEKAFAEPQWSRRAGYALLGELHIPGRLRIWHVIKELRRLGLWDDRPRKVLDAGGGEGAFAYYLARRFPSWTVVVADIEEETLERGRRMRDALGLQNLQLRRQDLLQLADDSAYDLIICSDVLEHVLDDRTMAARLAGALAKGGVVIFTSPSVPQPRHLALVRWRERRIGFRPEHYGHVRDGYSADGMRQLMEESGLVPERVRYTFGRCGTLMFDLFFATGDSRPNPLVYAALFPLYIGLSALDVALPARHGAAVLAVGRKP
jgi:SAM-dependent methyltransferase